MTVEEYERRLKETGGQDFGEWTEETQRMFEELTGGLQVGFIRKSPKKQEDDPTKTEANPNGIENP